MLDTASEIAGAGLETLFYQSVLALIAYRRSNHKVYYWRTVNGVEVDFVLYGENILLAIEIKHANNVDPSMLTGIKHFKADYPMAKGVVLYLGDKVRYFDDDIIAYPFTQGLAQLDDWLTD